MTNPIMYREIKQYMNFPDMFDDNYIVYEEIKDDILEIYVKYTMKSDNIDTEGKMMPGEVKILKYSDIKKLN